MLLLLRALRRSASAVVLVLSRRAAAAAASASSATRAPVQRRRQRAHDEAARAALVRVAVVGRPNVGKSSLFNRLAGRRLALVDNTPGLTRDVQEAPAQLGDLSFTLFDTAGYEQESNTAARALLKSTLPLTQWTINHADVVVFMVDGREGLTPTDETFARLLRKANKPVVLVANKIDSEHVPCDSSLTRLGFGDPVQISAEHAFGLGELYRALQPHHDAALARNDAPESAEAPMPDEASRGDDATEPTTAVAPVRVSIIGRPNVGKSTLVNRILKQERMLTAPMPGVTRTAIAVETTVDGRPLVLCDTAGIRSRSHVSDPIEAMSVASAIQAIRQAHVVVLVLSLVEADSTAEDAPIITHQDRQLAALVVQEGKALVVACNKWDLVTDSGATQRHIKEQLTKSLHQLHDVPVIPISALRDRGVPRLLRHVFAAHDAWETRIPTGELNKWLWNYATLRPPPVKLRYMTQVRTRPPTFTLFTARSGPVDQSYLRHITHELMQRFSLHGVPVRVLLRHSENPYEGRRREGAAIRHKRR